MQRRHETEPEYLTRARHELQTNARAFVDSLGAPGLRQTLAMAKLAWAAVDDFQAAVCAVYGDSSPVTMDDEAGELAMRLRSLARQCLAAVSREIDVEVPADVPSSARLEQRQLWYQEIGRRLESLTDDVVFRASDLPRTNAKADCWVAPQGTPPEAAEVEQHIERATKAESGWRSWTLPEAVIEQGRKLAVPYPSAGKVAPQLPSVERTKSGNFVIWKTARYPVPDRWADWFEAAIEAYPAGVGLTKYVNHSKIALEKLENDAPELHAIIEKVPGGKFGYRIKASYSDVG